MTRAFAPARQSPLHHRHETAGVRWATQDGWLIPEAYGEPAEEARRVRAGAGLQDASATGKLEIRGSRLEPALDALVGRPGLTVLRLRPDQALVLAPPGPAPLRIAGLEPGPDAVTGPPGSPALTDLTSALAAFRLAGPGARELLSAVSSLDLRDSVLAPGAVTQGGLARVHVIAWRETHPDLPSYLLLVARDVAEYAWDLLLDAGDDGVTRFGTAAERILRRGR